MQRFGIVDRRVGVAASRRDFLRAGTAGAMGLTLGDLLSARANAGGTTPPARAVIVLWLWGGPSHLDTFDMKPDAPVEYRGPFEPIATAVPGLHICELLPGLARRADRFALLRAMHHESNDHGIAGTIALTGSIAGAVGLGGAANTQAMRPSTGAIVGRLHRRERGVAAAVRHPRQPAPPGPEAGRRRGGRLARQHVRPVPPRLRAGRRAEAARRRTSRWRRRRAARGALGLAPGHRAGSVRADRRRAGRAAGAAVRAGAYADRLAREPGGPRRRPRAGAGRARPTGRTGSASAA